MVKHRYSNQHQHKHQHQRTLFIRICGRTHTLLWDDNDLFYLPCPYQTQFVTLTTTHIIGGKFCVWGSNSKRATIYDDDPNNRLSGSQRSFERIIADG